MHLIRNLSKLKFIFHFLSIVLDLSCMAKPTREAAIQEVPLDSICIPAIWQLKSQLHSSPATSSLEREWRDSPHHECLQTGSLDDPVLTCALSDGGGGFQPHWAMQELAVHGNSPAGDAEQQAEEDLPAIWRRASIRYTVRSRHSHSGLLRLHLQKDGQKQPYGLPVDVWAAGQSWCFCPIKKKCHDSKKT